MPSGTTYAWTANGGTGTEWNAGTGSGGGGPGGNSAGDIYAVGGTGGLYGGGGGGGQYTSGNSSTGGPGGGGIIVITYTVASYAQLNPIYLTSGTTWTVPADWSNTANTIEAIGGGAGSYAENTSSDVPLGGGGVPTRNPLMSR
jgi:hypothetical protein